MKKIVLLFISVFAFGWQGNAQISIGSGSATNQSLPIEPYYGYSYSQVIYLQSEIGAAGDITTLTWEFAGSSISNSNDWTIYIGHTSKTEFSSTSDWIPTSSMTQVYSGIVTVNGSNQVVVDITDFTYNNVDNLVIAVDENASSYNGSSDDFYCSSVSGSRGIEFHSDGTNPDPASPPSGNLKSYIANITLGGISQACPDPSAQSVANITSSSADLSWTDNAGTSMWNIEYGPTGFTQGSGTTVSASNNPYMLSGLMDNTTYDWYVQADCGGSGTSAWVGPNTFTTLPAPGTCGLFKVDLIDSYGDGWNGGTLDVYINGTIYYSGLTLSSGYGPERYYIPVDMSDVLSFDYTAGSYSTENEYKVYDESDVLVADEGASGTTPGDIGDPAIPSGLTACASCPDPSSQSVANITSSSADLSWTDNAGASMWNIEYGPTGFTQGSGTTVSVSANPYTLSGLTANTTYDWYVQADCGGSGTSAWVGPNTFTTALSNPSPCQLGFSIPDNSCTSANQWQVDVTSAPGTQLGTDVILSSVKIIISHTYDSDLDIHLTSPNGVQVELSTDNGGSGDNYGDPADNTCTSVTEFNMSAGTSITAGSAPFIGSFVPEGDFNSFNDNSTPIGLWVLQICDDFGGDVGTLEYVELVFSTPPSCPDPSSQSVANITSSSADLSWTDNAGASMWNIEYGPTGFTQGSGTTVSASNNPYMLSGLMDNTTYDWYVQADCGGSGTSAWVGPNTFSTVPVNDDCSGAIVLTVGSAGACPTNQVSANATTATESSAELVSCDGFGNNGVWFEFVAPASGEVVINYTAGTATGNPGVVVFDACGGTEVAGTCQNNPASLANITGLTGGNTYKLLLWFDGSAVAGTFDICLEDIPACSPPPSAQSVANITQATADLSWTDNAGASMWNIEYGPTGFTQGSGTTVSVSANPYTLSGLTSNTTYDWYVQSDCGGGNGTSNWVGPNTFTTLCDPLTVPYSNDFSVNADCWTVTDVNGDGITWVLATASCNGAGLRVSYNSSAAMDDWVYSPGFTLTGGTAYQVSFSSGNNSTIYTEKLEVFLMDDSDPAAPHKILLYRDENINENACYNSDIVFTAPSGWSGYYIGFHGYSIADQYYLYVDDFSIDVAPASSSQTAEDNNANTCDLYTINGVAGSNWHYIYNGSNVVAAVNANNQDLGTVFVEMRDAGSVIETGNDSGAGGANRKIMPKYFNFDAENIFTSPVSLRIYYTDTELSDFNAAAPVSSHAASDLDVTHYDGPNEDCDVTNNNPPDNTAWTLIDNASISNVGISGGFYLEFDVSSFSEIIAHEPAQGPLPIELVSFSAKAEGTYNLISWTTASEHHTAWMIVERSADAVSGVWSEIGRVEAHPDFDEMRSYQLRDENPLPVSYYRIRSVDLDGKEEFSPLRVVTRVATSDEVISLKPVPARDKVFLTLYNAAPGTVTLEIHDLSGRLLQRREVNLSSEGLQEISIDMHSIPSGIYYLKVFNERWAQTLSLIKE